MKEGEPDKENCAALAAEGKLGMKATKQATVSHEVIVRCYGFNLFLLPLALSFIRNKVEVKILKLGLEIHFF